jgi:hypothetical protein
LYKRIIEYLYHSLGFSGSRYLWPLDSCYRQLFSGSPEHTGVFRYALDIAVPTQDLGHAYVYVPCDGIVRSGVLRHSIWGTTPEYTPYLNWIHVAVSATEFYELAHVASLNHTVLNVGDQVIAGQPIMRVALNGRITTTNDLPDTHLHFMVGRWLDRYKTSFVSLQVRWRQEVYK